MLTSRATNFGVDMVTMWGRLAHVPTNRHPVVMCPGWTGDRDYFPFDATGIDYSGRAQSAVLTDAGLICGTIGTLHYWGNATWRAQIDALITILHFSSRLGPVHFYGISGGGMAALTYAMHYPERVRSIVAFIAPPDLQSLYDRDPLNAEYGLGIQADISAAYGGRPTDADNPMKNPKKLRDIPILLYYSENDRFCLASEVRAFAEAVGPNCHAVSMGAPTRGTPPEIYGHMISSDVYHPFIGRDFLLAHDAG